MTLRGIAVVLGAVSIVVAAFFLGRTAGLNTPAPVIVVDPVLDVGTQLPLTVVQSETTGLVDLRSSIDTAKPTIVVIAQLNCGSCLDEARRWAALHQQYGARRHFLGLFCDRDPTIARAFRDRARLQFDTFLCEPGVLESLARITPAVYEIQPNGRIAFAAFGIGSSIPLAKHIDETLGIE